MSDVVIARIAIVADIVLAKRTVIEQVMVKVTMIAIAIAIVTVCVRVMMTAKWQI